MSDNQEILVKKCRVVLLAMAVTVIGLVLIILLAPELRATLAIWAKIVLALVIVLNCYSYLHMKKLISAASKS